MRSLRGEKMTHGYEWFEYDYIDLDEPGGVQDWDTDEIRDNTISDSWAELDQIYEEYS